MLKGLPFLAYSSIDMHLVYRYRINNNNFGTPPTVPEYDKSEAVSRV
jgi:hypothetical protein